MANETKEIKYSYEGDVSSLREATGDAIKLLDQFRNKMASLSETDMFKASKRSEKSFNASINRMVKDVTRLQSKLKSVGDVRLPTGSLASTSISQTLGAITTCMKQVDGADKITTKSLNEVREALNGVDRELKGAQDSFDRIINSEQRFQNILGSVQNKVDGLKAVMDSARTRISSTFDPVSQKLNSFSSLFDPLISKIQSWKDRASIAFTRVSQLSSTVASAFRRVSSAESDASDSTDKSAKKHRSLGEALDSIRAKFDSEKKSIEGEEEELERKNSRLDDSKKKHSSLGIVIANLTKNFSSENRALRSLNFILNSFNNIGSMAKRVVRSLIGIDLASWLADAVAESIDYVEVLNLFTVAMGSTVNEARDFVDQMSEIYGMDPKSIMNTAGTFYLLADAIEMPEEAATRMSLSLTKAANDIASLYNKDIQTVTDNLMSGMQGMSRAVRKYGFDIRATTLQQTAFKYGLSESVSTMSEANRQALRYLTMMEQMSKATEQLGRDIDGNTAAMGDFANTIESPANQLRIFKEQIVQFGRSIGNFIITPIAKAIVYINGLVMALRSVANFIGQLLGVLNVFGGDTSTYTSGMDSAASSIGGIGDAASGAAKKIKNLLTPFDELNILAENASDAGDTSGGAALDDVLDPSLAQAISDMELKLENIRMKANEVRDAILKFLGFEFDANGIIKWNPEILEQNLINKFPQWTKTIQAVFDNWSDIWGALGNVFESIGGVLDRVKEKLLGFISIFINDETVSEFIDNLAENLNKLSNWIDEHQESIANAIILFGALWAAFKVFSGVSALLAPVIEFMSTCATVLSPFAEVIALAGIIVGVIALLYSSSEEFAASFDNLLNTVAESFSGIIEAAGETLDKIWQGIEELWEDSIKPMLKSTGDALAPVLDTIAVLWEYVSKIIADAITLIGTLWEEVLMPIFKALCEAVSNVMAIFKRLWEEILGPIIEYIGEGIYKLWQEVLMPIIKNVIDIVGNLIEAVLGLWNNVLKPLIDWLIRALGPSIKNIIKTIWDVASSLFSSLGKFINGLLTSLKGVTDFLAGVFTGNWKRAWKGVVNIFVGIGNSIISVFELVVNAIAGLINSVISAIYNAVVGLANLVLSAVEGVGEKLGFNAKLRITAEPPKIPTQSWARIPAMANGGVVTNPTEVLVGEGKYSEAIIPLDDSPQMQRLIDKIADAVKSSKYDSSYSVNDPIEVHVYLDGNEITSQQNRTNRMYGRTQQRV